MLGLGQQQQKQNEAHMIQRNKFSPSLQVVRRVMFLSCILESSANPQHHGYTE